MGACRDPRTHAHQAHRIQQGLLISVHFCTGANTPYRHVSLECIEEEIKQCIENDMKLGLFCGSYLNHKNFGTKVLKLLKKYRGMGCDISSADTLFIYGNNDDQDFFDLLDEVVPDKEALSIAIGIQCSDQETLSLCNRKFRKRSIHNLFTKWKFQIMAQVIIGLPGDDILKIAGTLAYIAKYEPFRIQTFPLAILPNTCLFENKKKFNIKANEAAPHELFSIGDQSQADVKKMKLTAESFAMEYNAFH
jgi:radical SAM superfamily enzyme YgiQ (UPF0313 family)